jgi:hypothetical protein
MVRNSKISIIPLDFFLFLYFISLYLFSSFFYFLRFSLLVTATSPPASFLYFLLLFLSPHHNHRRRIVILFFPSLQAPPVPNLLRSSLLASTCAISLEHRHSTSPVMLTLVVHLHLAVASVLHLAIAPSVLSALSRRRGLAHPRWEKESGAGRCQREPVGARFFLAPTHSTGT